MQDFQQRVITEENELSEKLEKLVAFLATDIFESLPLDEQERLEIQLHHMDGYQSALKNRIAAFT